MRGYIFRKCGPGRLQRANAVTGGRTEHSVGIATAEVSRGGAQSYMRGRVGPLKLPWGMGHPWPGTEAASKLLSTIYLRLPVCYQCHQHLANCFASWLLPSVWIMAVLPTTTPYLCLGSLTEPNGYCVSPSLTWPSPCTPSVTSQQALK